MSQSIPTQTTCPCSNKSFKDFKRHSKSKTHIKWVEDTLNELLPLLTPIDELPPPPQWMLDDDDDDEPIQLSKPKKQIFTTFFEEAENENDVDIMYVNWEDEHNDIFDNDTRLLERKERNFYLLWVDDVKKYYKWKKGDTMFFTLKQNTDNVFKVFKSNWGPNGSKIYDMKIDENGFVYYYDYYGYMNDECLGFVKVNSKYNDLIKC